MLGESQRNRALKDEQLIRAQAVPCTDARHHYFDNRVGGLSQPVTLRELSVGVRR
jgi:hypothetical protein